jgi:hypothetical protein
MTMDEINVRMVRLSLISVQSKIRQRLYYHSYLTYLKTKRVFIGEKINRNTSKLRYVNRRHSCDGLVTVDYTLKDGRGRSLSLRTIVAMTSRLQWRSEDLRAYGNYQCCLVYCSVALPNLSDGDSLPSHILSIVERSRLILACWTSGVVSSGR